MAPVLIALVLFKYVYGDMDIGVKFEFRTSGGLSTVNVKTILRSRVIRDVLFADNAALLATTLEEAPKLVNRLTLPLT